MGCNCGGSKKQSPRTTTQTAKAGAKPKPSDARRSLPDTWNGPRGRSTPPAAA